MQPFPTLSPFVTRLLSDNNFELLQVMRYGPRFACLEVRAGNRTGLLKLVLPDAERIYFTPKNYVWTDDDQTAVLEARLLKETLFLQFFSQEFGPGGFEPELIALSEQSPVWSLRTYINEPSMSAWDSSFVFRKDFYNQVQPQQVVRFFHGLHQLSSKLPEPLRRLAIDYVPLTLSGRFKEAAVIARAQPKFRDYAAQISTSLERSRPAYQAFERVITHYEPYSCHLFVVRGRIALIDWENVGWGHPLHDLSIFWMRMIDNAAWRDEFEAQIDARGYFRGSGRLFWDNELMMQSLANLNHLHYGGQFGTPAFTKRAIAFFEATIQRLLNESPYFKA